MMHYSPKFCFFSQRAVWSTFETQMFFLRRLDQERHGKVYAANASEIWEASFPPPGFERALLQLRIGKWETCTNSFGVENTDVYTWHTYTCSILIPLYLIDSLIWPFPDPKEYQEVARRHQEARRWIRRMHQDHGSRGTFRIWLSVPWTLWFLFRMIKWKQ